MRLRSCYPYPWRGLRRRANAGHGLLNKPEATPPPFPTTSATAPPLPMSEALRSGEVIVGVDTHKHVHAAVAINRLGARLGATTIPVAAKGYRELEVWACSLGAVRAFGIEGTGS